MKYILDIKDYVTKLDSDVKDTNETFYSYNIIDDNDNIVATVWFTQMVYSGNIYSVSCKLMSDELKDFNLYFNVPMNGPYRPFNWYFKTPNKDIDEISFYEMVEGMEMIREIARCVMTIFGDAEHLN